MVSRFPWRAGTRFCFLGIFISLTIASGAALPSYSQEVGYNSESLFIALFSDGDALVEYDISFEDPVAEEIRVRLHGENSTSNLIVVDNDDNLIEYDPGQAPNEIVIRTPGVSNARISYSTQDLVDKLQGRWIFSLNSSSIGMAVRLPPDSVLINPGENFPTIRQVGDLQLLTFKPGDVRFVYVIGVLGTEEQANIVIRLAETTIKETVETYPGINLTAANSLLQSAIAARDDERFPDAESLAGDANDAALTAASEYDSAQKAISAADSSIRQAVSEGRDTAAASQLLQQANTEFAAGSYVAAKDSAEDAVAAIGSLPPRPEMPLFVIVAAAVAAGGGIGALVLLRMRKPRPIAPQKRAEQPRDIQKQKQENNARREPAGGLDTRKQELLPDSVPKTIGYVSPPDTPSMIPESQLDRSVLSGIVSKIMEERPHLRPEDKEVLTYLAEKEGAAFESEIRSKFQLPKTTIWRLVKRLEREELVEIRKAGGQNLIKLKFEDRQS
jgi:hypothetical protein